MIIQFFIPPRIVPWVYLAIKFSYNLALGNIFLGENRLTELVIISYKNFLIIHITYSTTISLGLEPTF